MQFDMDVCSMYTFWCHYSLKRAVLLYPTNHEHYFSAQQSLNTTLRNSLDQANLSFSLIIRAGTGMKNKFGSGFGYQINFESRSGTGPHKTWHEKTFITGKVLHWQKMFQIGRFLLEHQIFHGHRVFHYSCNTTSIKWTNIVFEVGKYNSWHTLATKINHKH